MVNGFERFVECFKDYQDQFVIIGGYACTLHYFEKGVEFRHTHDLDIVLIIEDMRIEFYTTLWNYLSEGGYVTEAQTSTEHHYYRFETKDDTEYPKVIELLSRKSFELNRQFRLHITPIHIDENIRSLSAIVLNDDYYHLIRENRVLVRGISVLSLEFIVILKIKAYLDLSELRRKGIDIKSSNIRKHRSDVLKIVREMMLIEIHDQLSSTIKNDIQCFTQMINDDIQANVNLGMRSIVVKSILKKIEHVFIGEEINNPHA